MAENSVEAPKAETELPGELSREDLEAIRGDWEAVAGDFDRIRTDFPFPL